MRLILLMSLASLLASAPSSAAIERFAILAGNDSGARDEPNLRFAEADAEKLGQALIDVGDFPPENVLVLKGRDAAALRRAIIALNDRIRARTETPGVEPLLLVYFSGHADTRSIHLGDSALELSEIEQLVRGSAAKFRLLILDACRSGSLTQVKGGTVIDPFPIKIADRLEGEGVVFLTSSAASEDAQESDELKGSFFTHYFVSALLGAADENHDGRVGLREAYGFTYESTLRASSRTLAGVQHPTFRFEMQGKSDLVLSEPYRGEDRAMLELPSDRPFLVLADGSEGAVIAEIGSETGVRRLGLRPGRYFLRSRGRDHLLEGTVALGRGQRKKIAEEELERIAYARLVRKGGSTIDLVHGAEIAYRVRQGLYDRDRPCHGAIGSFGLDLESLSVALRAGACRGGFENNALAATTTEISFELGTSHAWDLPPFAIDLGLDAGLSLIGQSFETRGRAPDRWSLAPTLAAGASGEIDLGSGFFFSAEMGAALYLVQRDELDGTKIEARPVLRGGGGFGKRW
jgi:hypothetical protein